MVSNIHKLIILVLLMVCASTVVWAQSDSGQVNPVSDSEYKLSPGDVVSVTVFGEPDISVASMRVPLSGIYNYPLIGEVNLIDQSMTSLAKVLESKLRAGFLSDPKVSVNIVSYRPVIVTGTVESEGLIDYQEGMTIRILSALVKVNTRSLNLEAVEIQRGSSTFNPEELDSAVSPGDIVSFNLDPVVITGDYYYIYGEVNRSGKYEFENDLTVEKAIIVAGGYTPFASKRNIRIRRDGAEDPIKVKLHEPIQAGDVITVKKRWF